MEAARHATGPNGSTRVMLWLLLIVYVFNFIDRQIVNILAEPISRELNLSDTQIGLMTGIAFALFYTVLGLPIARYADKVTTQRGKLIAAALVIWSAITATNLAVRIRGSALSQICRYYHGQGERA